mgnify:CR=1 FL=1
MADQYYTFDDIFDQQQGFSMALAFSAYDSESKPILDESYGRVVFSSMQWGD